jgi:hypothetical protein
MALGNKTGMTTDVDSITNSAVMALDKVFRRNDIPFAHRHEEARELLRAMVASVVADEIASRTVEETRDERIAA